MIFTWIDFFYYNYKKIIMEFSKNYGQIIIGYGLLSIGITLVMLFLQTAGILWLVFASVTIVVAIWIIKRERNARKKYDSDNDCSFQDNKPE